MLRIKHCTKFYNLVFRSSYVINNVNSETVNLEPTEICAIMGGGNKNECSKVNMCSKLLCKQNC